MLYAVYSFTGYFLLKNMTFSPWGRSSSRGRDIARPPRNYTRNSRYCSRLKINKIVSIINHSIYNFQVLASHSPSYIQHNTSKKIAVNFREKFIVIWFAPWPAPASLIFYNWHFIISLHKAQLLWIPKCVFYSLLKESLLFIIKRRKLFYGA